MVEFMVLGLPRSGTTWASNWLTTDSTLCIHDPLYKFHYSDLDDIPTGKTLGISCTGLYQFPEFVNAHPARKVILHRDIDEINDSMERIGLGKIDYSSESELNKIDGWHVYWTEIFDNPKPIYEFLLQKPFDAERHNFLKEVYVQPNFEHLLINKSVGKRFVEELAKGLVN